MGKTFDVSVADGSRRIGVHVETLKKWAREGKIPAVKTVSGKWMFSAEDLDAVAVRSVTVDA